MTGLGPIGTLMLRRKTCALRCFEPLTEAEAGTAAIARYSDAFALLEADDPKARQAFAAFVGKYGEDPLAMFHLGRLLAGDSGVEIELTEK